MERIIGTQKRWHAMSLTRKITGIQDKRHDRLTVRADVRTEKRGNTF